MNVYAEHKLINSVLDDFRHQLDEIPDEQFTATPADGSWSAAELYSHILQAGLGSTIAAEKCCRRTGVVTNKGLNWIGKFVFWFNRLPPVKAKAPAALDAVTKKISKEEARNLIVRLRKRIDELTPLLANSASDSKIPHPRLGLLNGGQWLKFIRIHTQHHFKQLMRIKKSYQQ